jgi:protein-L-isoaspartate(D-aspartate) O-methyltransferase
MKAGEAEQRAQLLLQMRARGLRDLALLRAMERAPRSLFMPQRYSDLAWRDMALPIGCGQTATPPSVVAAMIEALSLSPGDRVLEVGTGAGYAAALLAQCAREVVSLERYETLAAEAAARLATLGLDNVDVRWADGLAVATEPESFDRILVQGLLEPPATSLAKRLAPGGLLVGAILDAEPGRQRLLLLRRAADGATTVEAGAALRTLSPLVPGLAHAG